MTTSVGASSPDLDGRSDDDLAQERDFLLRSLADLDAERDAGDVGEHDYAALRDGYTARAAAVLRALDRRRVGAELDRAVPPPTPAERVPRKAHGAPDPHGAPDGRRRVGRRPTSPWRTVGALVGVVAVAVLAGVGVEAAVGQRLPGDNISGSTPTGQVQKLLAQARDQFGQGHLLDAIKTYDRALAVDPRNAEALAYKGWLLRLAGSQAGNVTLIDTGLASIRQAEAADPSYADPHFFAGETLLRDKHDPRGAVTELEQFLADHPPAEMAPEVQGELEAARAALTAAPANAAPANAAPANAAPANVTPTLGPTPSPLPTPGSTPSPPPAAGPPRAP